MFDRCAAGLLGVLAACLTALVLFAVLACTPLTTYRDYTCPRYEVYHTIIVGKVVSTEDTHTTSTTCTHITMLGVPLS